MRRNRKPPKPSKLDKGDLRRDLTQAEARLNQPVESPVQFAVPYATDVSIAMGAGERVVLGVPPGISSMELGDRIIRILNGNYTGILKRTMEHVGPVGLELYCPATLTAVDGTQRMCGFRHIDEGMWAHRPHKTHVCKACGHHWRPAAMPTVGVKSVTEMSSSDKG